MASNEEPYCHFYLDKKKRYCRFRPKTNQKYCPEHGCKMGIQEERKRIPCPLNPNHNCLEDNLKNHLKKCNVTKIRQAVEKLPYFVRDINKGNQSDCKEDDESTTSGSVKVKDLTSQRLGEMIEKVIKLFSEVVEDIEKLYLEHPHIKEEIVGNLNLDLKNAFGNQAVLRKEMLQQASLVGQLDSLAFLSSPYYFVELGAGKGKLSHWIYKASQESVENSFLLVERSSVRHKVDQQGEDAERYQRIKIDIQDLCLGKVPGIQARDPVVVVGKHLCGGATDLGIRCAVNTLDAHTTTNTQLLTLEKSKNNPSATLEENSCSAVESHIHEDTNTNNKTPNTEKKKNESPNPDPSSQTSVEYVKSLTTESESAESPPTKVRRLTEETESKNHVRGVMIALCCHHQCTWDTYVGRDFMRRHGINEAEFDLLTRLSSWATCAKRRIRGKSSSKKDLSEDTNTTSSKQSEGLETHQAASQDVEETVRGSKEEEEEEEHSVKDLIKADLADNICLREKLSVPERENIGRKAKRIIDMGRIDYLRSRNMTCFLREYIHEDVTPENVVLIATNNDSPLS